MTEVPIHAGRAALARALQELEARAGYGTGTPKRSRARAIAAVGAVCEKRKLPVPTVKAVSDWFRLGSAAEDFEPLWLLVATLLTWAGESDSRAQRDVWKQRWELAKITQPRRPALGVAVGNPSPQPVGQHVCDINPILDLEVHPAIEAAKAPGGTTTVNPLPPYVERKHDDHLRRVVLQAEKRSRLVVLIGGSSTGKTRSLWEAVQYLPQEWRVWRPADRAALLDGLAREPSMAHTVLWLNELQRFLLPRGQAEPDGQAAAGLTTLLTHPGRGPVLVVGTLWHEHYTALSQRPREAMGPDPQEQARALLNGNTVTVAEIFTADETIALRRLARHDTRLAEALARGGTRITQYLAGGAELVRRYKEAAPEARAVLDAAADARRLGVSEDLPEAFLYTAAAAYLDPGHWSAQTDDWRASWFSRALDFCSIPCRGVPGPLTAEVPLPGQLPADSRPLWLADYLQQHISHARRCISPPAGFWDAAIEHLPNASDLITLGQAATRRLRWRVANRLYGAAVEAEGILKVMEEATRLEKHYQFGDAARIRRAVSVSHQVVLSNLGFWQRRARVGAERLARAVAEAGYPELLVDLARSWEEAGERDEAERLYRVAAKAGHTRSLTSLARLREDAGDRGEAEQLARAAAKAGHTGGLAHLARLREDAGDRGEAERLARVAAEAGDPQVLTELAVSHMSANRMDEAEALLWAAADAGDPEALMHLGLLWGATGERDEADRLYRAAAKAGHSRSLVLLADLWEQAGDREEAERLAFAAVEAGHTDAFAEMAEAREQAGEWEEAERLYRAAADAGDPVALTRLADLRDKAGKREEADRLYRVAADAGHGDELRFLAAVRQGNGEQGEAERLCRIAVAGGDTRSLSYLAELRELAGDHEEAERLYRAAADAGSILPTEIAHLARLMGIDEERLRRYGLEADGRPASPW